MSGLKPIRLGFCADHFEQMLHQKNRLSLALMLESHLKELKEQNFKPILQKARAHPKKRGAMSTVNDTCFVCEKIEWALSRMLDTIVQLYGRDADFRKLFSEQESLCLLIWKSFSAPGADKLPKKEYPAFEKAALDSYYEKFLTKSAAMFLTSVRCLITAVPVQIGEIPGTPLSGRFCC